MPDFHWSFNEITSWSDSDVQSFWEFRQNGEFCYALFKTIKANLLYYEELAVTIDGDVETYNTQCSDLCLPGYLKCDYSRPDTCVPECECCDLAGGTCCAGPNHSEDEVDIGATVHKCWEWCCEDTETRCHDYCYPYGADMGLGFGHPDLPEDVEDSGSDGYTYDEEPEVSTEGYPRYCCEGQDCCDEGLTYIPWMTTQEPICCVPNTMVEILDHDCCCLEEENSYCCPDLEDHCQNA